METMEETLAYRKKLIEDMNLEIWKHQCRFKEFWIEWVKVCRLCHRLRFYSK
jgi:hypothetical protein